MSRYHDVPGEDSSLAFLPPGVASPPSLSLSPFLLSPLSLVDFIESGSPGGVDKT